MSADMEVDGRVSPSAEAEHAGAAAASSLPSVPSSLPFSATASNNSSSSSLLAVPSSSSARESAASPTNTSATKRNIGLVSEAAQNHRLSAPSPPKSPVRLRGCFAAAVAGAAEASSSPARSPIRIAAVRDRAGSHLSTPCHSPTRGAAHHGLPASPQTPTRAKSVQGSASGSPSPLLGAAASAGSRSPISAFYFPNGMPPSPSSKQHTQATLSQLSLAHAGGFDAEIIEQLTGSVLRLPKYVAPYVQQQCLLIQQHKRELQAMVADMRARELARKRLQRRMQHLRRSSAGRSQRSSLGSLHAAIKNTSIGASGSDMSIDSAAPAAATILECASPVHPVAAPLSLTSPSSIGAGRERNISTTSTTSSVQTSLSFSAPSSPAPNAAAAATSSSADVDADALDESSEALLSPLSISRVSDTAELNTSLLNVSAHDTSNTSLTAAARDESPEGDAAAEEAAASAADLAALESDQRILPATFLYYFKHHLESFKDPHTRFFRVLLSNIDYLMDAPDSDAGATISSNSATSTPATTPSALRLKALHVSTPIPSPSSAGLHALIPLPPQPVPSSSSPSSAAAPPALQRHHFHPLLESILATHPGLEFLASTPEFQSKYSQTCIERIFYTVDLKGCGKITLPELRRADLLGEVMKLQEEPDINLSLKFFSYQHFYVLYCKYWEIDAPDHDGLLTLANLLEYENRSLSRRICERIMSQACTKKNEAGEEVAAGEGETAAAAAAPAGDQDEDLFPAGDRGDDSDLHTPRMSYCEFIPFMLAEVDKTTPQSLNFWFRLLDLDHDHVLSLFELDWFFSEQVQKIQALSADTIRWVDIVCQLLDMIKGGNEGGEGMQVHGGGIMPAAPMTPSNKAAHHQAKHGMTRAPTHGTPPRARLRPAAPVSTPSALLSSSALSFEFSSCHITRKDLARSHLQSYFLNLFFNLPRFLSHESRDPVKARAAHEAQEKGISEWETYAAHMYSALVANEELQARAAEQHQLQQNEQAQDEQELMDDGEAAVVDTAQQQLCEEEEYGMDDLQQSQQQAHHQHDDEPTTHDTEMEHEVDEPAPVSRSPTSARTSRRSQQHHSIRPDAASASALSSESIEFMQSRWGINATSESGPVRVYASSTSTGGEPKCFFVQDEDEVPGEDEAATSESQVLHAQVPAAAAVLLAQAHQPAVRRSAARASTSRSPSSSPLNAHQQRQRLRQEEREYLALQRKIHSSDDSSSGRGGGAADYDDEESVSPTASSRPISIPSPTHTSSSLCTGSSPQLAKLHMHSSSLNAQVHAPAASRASAASGVEDASSSSVSPPYVSMSTAPRRSSPLQQMSSGSRKDEASSPSARALALAAPAPGKENDEVASPSSRGSAASASVGASNASAFKRQLFGSTPQQSAADRSPLSPSRTSQPWQ